MRLYAALIFSIFLVLVFAYFAFAGVANDLKNEVRSTEMERELIKARYELAECRSPAPIPDLPEPESNRNHHHDSFMLEITLLIIFFPLGFLASILLSWAALLKPKDAHAPKVNNRGSKESSC